MYPCLGKKTCNVLFIKLGTKEMKKCDWGDDVVLVPRLQQLKDTPPEVKAKTANRTACNRRSKSITQYCMSQSLARENATPVTSVTPVISRVERLIVNASEGSSIVNNDTSSTRSVKTNEDSTTSATTISPVQHEKQRIDELHARASKH